MSASIHHYDCTTLGICQRREPPCPGGSQSMAWRDGCTGEPMHPVEQLATANQPFWMPPHPDLLPEAPADPARLDALIQRSTELLRPRAVPPPDHRLLEDPDDDAGLGWAIWRGWRWALLCAVVAAATATGVGLWAALLWQWWLAPAWRHLLALLP
jgi:hypothetical protein